MAENSGGENSVSKNSAPVENASSPRFTVTPPVRTPGVEFTCPQCGAIAEVPKLTKGALRYCPNCGAANINPAQTTAAALTLAEASSPADALDLYNEILRTEPHNYHAWLGRGHSLGSLATLENDTLDECGRAIENAVRFAPYDVKTALAPDISRRLETFALAHYAAADSLVSAYMSGEYIPTIVGQAWQVYVQATFRALGVLQSAAEYDPFNRSALRNAILMCQYALKGRTCAVRHDVQGPEFVAGPLWFVAAAMIVPVLMQNGRLVLEVAEPDRIRLNEIINQFAERMRGIGEIPPLPPPLPVPLPLPL